MAKLSVIESRKAKAVEDLGRKIDLLLAHFGLEDVPQAEAPVEPETEPVDPSEAPTEPPFPAPAVNEQPSNVVLPSVEVPTEKPESKALKQNKKK